jgi:uncharacterized protein (DUF2461 family)
MKAAFGDLQQEGKLIRPPKGFNADAPHLDYLKLKSFIVWKTSSIKQNAPEELGKDVLAGFKDAYPLIAWLRDVT